MKLEEEFNTIDQSGSWMSIYHKIRQDCVVQHDFSVKDSKRPEFKGRNRYRDVSPYDHSRVRLKRNDIDYINASLLHCPNAGRKYILTQGPLPNTASHFWLMVWEYDSQAVLMLNRVVEKGQVKCHQYFPTGVTEDDNMEMYFEDVGLKVLFISEESSRFFLIRTLQLEDIESGEKKRVLQFHYTTWPDFGVPNSPEAFLDFLFAVRDAGVLDDDVGPPVIHCSAGIGRSGTFCLVDTCLVLIEKQQCPDMDVREVLMDMRRSRMGLIQTADQLRFSYMAIIEGCKTLLAPSILLGDKEPEQCDGSDDERIASNSVQDTSERRCFDSTSRADGDMGDTSEPAATTNNASASSCVIQSSVDPTEIHYNSEDDSNEQNRTDGDDNIQGFKATHLDQEIKRRKREERKKKTSEQIAKMKQKQKECEKWQLEKHSLQPYIWGLSLAVLVGSCIFYQCYL